MIRVSHRTGRNTAVSGGPIAIVFFLLLVFPFILIVQLFVWSVVAVVFVAHGTRQLWRHRGALRR